MCGHRKKASLNILSPQFVMPVFSYKSRLNLQSQYHRLSCVVHLQCMSTLHLLLLCLFRSIKTVNIGHIANLSNNRHNIISKISGKCIWMQNKNHGSWQLMTKPIEKSFVLKISTVSPDVLLLNPICNWVIL